MPKFHWHFQVLIFGRGDCVTVDLLSVDWLNIKIDGKIEFQIGTNTHLILQETITRNSLTLNNGTQWEMRHFICIVLQRQIIFPFRKKNQFIGEISTLSGTASSICWSFYSWSFASVFFFVIRSHVTPNFLFLCSCTRVVMILCLEGHLFSLHIFFFASSFDSMKTVASYLANSFTCRVMQRRKKMERSKRIENISSFFSISHVLLRKWNWKDHRWWNMNIGWCEEFSLAKKNQ